MVTSARPNYKKLIGRPLSKEEFETLIKVQKDPFFFATFVYLIHPIRGKTKFDLYPFQRSVLWQFITNRFTIILKFRQAGVTELISLFCLWLAMYHPNKMINIISIKDVVAKKVLRKIKYMYRNLPDYLKVPIINGRPNELGTASEMEFANGSLISSIPTTEEAGRSEALSLLVIDEAAIIRWADTIWASAFPTLSTGGRAILNSTPYGVGNFFHKRWVEACAGGNNFVPIRLKWEMHPDRGKDGEPCRIPNNPNYDPWWYNNMSQVLGPRRTAQEIDGDFLTSGTNVFDLTDIRAIEDGLDQYIPISYRTDPMFKNLISRAGQLGDSLMIFEKPKHDKFYSLGCDIATGRARDYSSFSIMDQDGEEVACFKKKITIDKLTYLIGDLGQTFNRALLGPESNDIGLGVATKLQQEGYHNLHYSTTLLKEKGKLKPKEEKIPGWYTTKKNRPVILGELEEDIRTEQNNIKSPFFTQEAYTFIYDDRNRAVAMGKGGGNSGGGDAESLFEDDVYTDDAIFAEAITNHIRKIRQRGPIILPV